MATSATQSQRILINLGNGSLLFRCTFSNITSDQWELLSYNYPDLPAAAPIYADFRVKTAPTNRCIIGMESDIILASAVNKTVYVRLYAETGGDLTGAVVDITLEFAPPGSAVNGILLAA